ncbi:MAG TPA: hypothetical protein VNZ57_05630 [Longimicrobiales bacterium]|nr:hypothetical protein [Longimicrobiales bacterium]
MARKGRKNSGTGVNVVEEAAALYASDAAETPKRKNYLLLQSKIDLARKVLGAATETEALDRALDYVIYGELLAQGTLAMHGEEYNDVLGLLAEIPGSAERG